jgi:acetyl-CoA carboxylase carboxyltransferase component
MSDHDEIELHKLADDVRRGGAEKYHEAARTKGKLFCRDRLGLLLDEASFVEDALFANVHAKELPADGVVTGVGTIDGRPVCVMANDSTVKAGSWGARTVEKILRIQETAMRLRVPLIYLVDSAGARITDQIQMFPGRRGAGRIFSNQVHMSGMVPQICLLFGPSAAGGAYIPAFCDVVVMVEGNASMYLGSPRMAQEVIGERVTLEEMGGARMHCTVSGCGDVLVQSEQDALAWARRYVGYLPLNHDEEPRRAEMIDPAPHRSIAEMIPANQNKPFDMREVVLALIDEGSWCEIKELFAAELLTGLARIGGRVVGILANQPKVRGGVLFVDSADKAARFIWLCDAFNIALIFLADVPGFMIGSKVERDGIIRHGAKMISAVTEATVPKFSVIVRKAYGAGLYAMAGPAFDPEVTIALPTAMIAVMGPEAAVNAVYANKIAELPEDERATFIEAKREEFRQDIDVYRLAGELVIDAIVDPDELRSELIARLDATGTRVRSRAPKRRPITPV